VKLLLDKLVTRLAELYPESIHVVEVGLLASLDREVWDFAKREDFIIVSTDSDFYDLATTIGPPPKVVWLRRWRDPTRDAEQVLRREAVRITEFASDPELAVGRGRSDCNLSDVSRTAQVVLPETATTRQCPTHSK
jgi:predicted nuclease of predicted toxin-antitoxin system